jgi:hypothetical protein
MNELSERSQRVIRCDLCKLGVVWIPVELAEATPTPEVAKMILDLVSAARWTYVQVANTPLAVCPTCQTVARALQIVDVERSQPDGAAIPDEAKT